MVGLQFTSKPHIYTNALHGLTNADARGLNFDPEGICGQLNFLELLLYFHQSQNPFSRTDLDLRPLVGNMNVGHHGPGMYDANAQPSKRKRNIPHNQVKQGGRGRAFREYNCILLLCFITCSNEEVSSDLLLIYLLRDLNLLFSSMNPMRLLWTKKTFLWS